MKILIPLVILAGCAEMVGQPYTYDTPYYKNRNAPYYSGNSYNDYYDRSSYYNRKERDRLERERIELERERTRLERERLERERRNDLRGAVPANPPAMTCPPGFSPSERKCTVEERRKGCRDMRLPNGLGCVDR